MSHKKIADVKYILHEINKFKPMIEDWDDLEKIHLLKKLDLLEQDFNENLIAECELMNILSIKDSIKNASINLENSNLNENNEILDALKTLDRLINKYCS